MSYPFNPSIEWGLYKYSPPPCTCEGCVPRKADAEEETINLSYQQSVIDLADELARQFDGLSISDALARANEIMQSSIEVEAYLEVMEDDEQ